MEDEYYELRKTRIPPFVPPKEKTDTEGAGENGEANAEPPSPSQDVAMPDVNGEVEEDPEDPEPKMRGTEAVEKRIEKVIQELQESGTVDVNDEVEFGIKKVRLHLRFDPPSASRDVSLRACSPSLSWSCFFGNGVVDAGLTDDYCA